MLLRGFMRNFNLVRHHFALNGCCGQQHNDGVRTADFGFDFLRPLHTDTKMPVDEHLVALLTQFGFDEIQQSSLRLNIGFINDGNQPGR